MFYASKIKSTTHKEKHRVENFVIPKNGIGTHTRKLIARFLNLITKQRRQGKVELLEIVIVHLDEQFDEIRAVT